MDRQLHIRSPRTVGDFITIGEVSLYRQNKNFWMAVAVTCRSMCNQFRGWLLFCALKLWNSCNIRLGKHCNMYNMLTLFSRQSCIRLVTMDVAHFICGRIICWEQDNECYHARVHLPSTILALLSRDEPILPTWSMLWSLPSGRV